MKKNNDTVKDFFLEEIDRLKLENYHLKLELIGRSLIELSEKKKVIFIQQSDLARQIEKKNNITLDNYDIDLISGKCIYRIKD